MSSKLTIPKSKLSTSIAKKRTLKRTSSVLTSELSKRGIPFKLPRNKTLKESKENKTIKFYKDNFRQILSIVILENTDETLKNNLKVFYEDVEKNYNKLINFGSDENLFDTQNILNRYSDMKKMTSKELIDFLKDSYKVNTMGNTIISLNTKLIKENDIEFFIKSQIDELNNAYTNMINVLEKLGQVSRRPIKPFQNEGIYFDFLKKYISLRKKIKEYFFIINNVITEKEGGILTQPIKEVSNMFLGSIGFYIIKTIQSEYREIYDISKKDDDFRDEPSIRIISLILKKLYGFVSNNIKINLDSYGDDLNEIRQNNKNFLKNVQYYKNLNHNSKILLNLDSDWENSLLKIMAMTLPKNIYIGNINQTNKSIPLKPNNTYVIDNGVNYHNNDSVKKFRPLCSGGNYVDGWTNTNCLNRERESIQRGQILSYDWKFDSDDEYSFNVKATNVTIKIDLKFNNKSLKLYNPKTRTREGLEEIKTSLIKTDYLEAANVAIRAFQVLFEDEINHIMIEGQSNEIIGLFRETDRKNYKRIEVLLNTEFMDYDEDGDIIMKPGGRSLFNKFYGCFLGKTSGDTTQYLEANSANFDITKNIVKVDKDRPAFVGDCVFRALAKSHMKGPTKPRKNKSISGYLNNENDTKYWCDDQHIQPKSNYDMLAWKMVVLVDTFHDYGFGNTGTRFKYIINELAIFYRRELSKQEIYPNNNTETYLRRKTKKNTNKYSTSTSLSLTSKMKKTKQRPRSKQIGGSIINQKANELAQLFMSALVVYQLNRFLESSSGRGINLNDYISVNDDLMNKISLLIIGKSYKELLIILEGFKLKNEFQTKIRDIIATYQKDLRMSHETGESIMKNMKDINNYIVTIDTIPKELKEQIIEYKTNFTLENPQKELLEKIRRQTIMIRKSESTSGIGRSDSGIGSTSGIRSDSGIGSTSGIRSDSGIGRSTSGILKKTSSNRNSGINSN